MVVVRVLLLLIIGLYNYDDIPQKQDGMFIMVEAFTTTTTTTTTITYQQRQEQQSRFKNKMTNHKPMSLLSSSSSFEGLMEDLPSANVVNAIVESSKKRRRTEASRTNNNKYTDNQLEVVAADVATMAGVSLSQAKRDLSLLASITQGDLAVDETGEIIYTFSSNLQQLLIQNSVQYKALQSFKRAWPVLFWLIRIGFGVTLLASIAAIFSTIFFIQTSSSSSSDDRDDRRGNNSNGSLFGGGGTWNYWLGPSPFDFFYYRPYGSYGYYGSTTATTTSTSKEEMGFLESIFSYVFGDGNPNSAIETRRLSLIANIIRQNYGSITAEQLAPFCQNIRPPNPSLDNEQLYVDEVRFVLPIVTALNGEPRVTEDGDIIYIFPDLQVTAMEEKNNNININTPTKYEQALLSSSSSMSSSSSSAAAKDKYILRRVGLTETSTNRDIRRLLEYNGYRIPTTTSTRQRTSEKEREELMNALEEIVVPTLTKTEQYELEQLEIDNDTMVLQEREWKFTMSSNLNTILAGTLGIVNLGGALYLGNLLKQLQFLSTTGTTTTAASALALPGWFGIVQNCYPLLLGYAVLYNMIPLIRKLWINRQNEQIRQRNNQRKQWKVALQKALSYQQQQKQSSSSLSSLSSDQSFSMKLQRKIKAARKLSQQMIQVGRRSSNNNNSKNNIVYDTSNQNMIQDMKQKQNKQELYDFDNQFKNMIQQEQEQQNQSKEEDMTKK